MKRSSPHPPHLPLCCDIGVMGYEHIQEVCMTKRLRLKFALLLVAAMLVALGGYLVLNPHAPRVRAEDDLDLPVTHQEFNGVTAPNPVENGSGPNAQS